MNASPNTPNLTELPLTDILPQRPPILLISRVLAADAESAVTESVVRRDWPLAGCAQNGVAALALIEVAAQTAGVCCSWQRILEKGLDSAQTGWIVAIKKARLNVAHLPFGAVIRAEAKKTINYGGFQEVETALHLAHLAHLTHLAPFVDTACARVLLQLYQPQEEA